MTWNAFLSICCLPVLPFALSAQSVDSTSLRERINALADRIAASEFVTLDVLEIPAEVSTRTRVTPDTLERSFHFRLTIADLRGWSSRLALVAALRSLNANPRSGNADLRWGVSFSGVDNRQLEFIYLDGSGLNGFLGKDPVTFSGEFFKFLNERFSPCFR